MVRKIGPRERSEPGPMEQDLAEAIVAAAERATGLDVRVGIADGKFAAYVAAVLAEGHYSRRAEG